MGYTTVNDPTKFFQIHTYTGSGSSRSFTNNGISNIAPDLVWTKKRSASQNHCWTDSSRGVGNILFSDASDAESATALLTSFDSDGFSVNTNALINENTATYVAWQWACNGGTTTAVSASGSGASQILASTYQVNTAAGFSIITYTGTGEDATVSHGLGAVPDVLLFKQRSDTNNWYMYHSANTGAPATDYMTFDTQAATADFDIWNDTLPTSTVFSISNSGVHGDTETFVCYAFKSVQGYSKFGSYRGNGGTDGIGTFVHTGFSPAWVMLKNTNTASTDWLIGDVEMGAYSGKTDFGHSGNPIRTLLEANTGDTENAAIIDFNFLSNGFQIRGGGNQGCATEDRYIYMAFAESPFVTTTGIPCTAR
tara:strand:- start:22 stop:1122 length:1101 start_codon:yes stop_codon:yes gene_type:complete